MAKKLLAAKARQTKGFAVHESEQCEAFEKISKTALAPPQAFCYMQPRRSNSAYHDAVVAELVDAQR